MLKILLEGILNRLFTAYPGASLLPGQGRKDNSEIASNGIPRWDARVCGTIKVCRDTILIIKCNIK